MPAFSVAADCAAPAEAVWRLLYDPRRFPEWWAGTARVEVADGAATRYLDGWPDLPMPTAVESRRAEGRVLISCLVSDIRMDWALAPAPAGCRVEVTCAIPEREGRRLLAMRDEVERSLARLVDRAESA